VTSCVLVNSKTPSYFKMAFVASSKPCVPSVLGSSVDVLASAFGTGVGSSSSVRLLPLMATIKAFEFSICVRHVFSSFYSYCFAIDQRICHFLSCRLYDSVECRLRYAHTVSSRCLLQSLEILQPYRLKFIYAQTNAFQRSHWNAPRFEIRHAWFAAYSSADSGSRHVMNTYS